MLGQQKSVEAQSSIVTDIGSVTEHEQLEIGTHDVLSSLLVAHDIAVGLFVR
jgi:hypothetical protein